MAPNRIIGILFSVCAVSSVTYADSQYSSPSAYDGYNSPSYPPTSYSTYYADEGRVNKDDSSAAVGMSMAIIAVVGIAFMMAAMSASVSDVNNRLMDLQDDLGDLDGRLRDQETRLQNAINDLANRLGMVEERGDNNRNLIQDLASRLQNLMDGMATSTAAPTAAPAMMMMPGMGMMMPGIMAGNGGGGGMGIGNNGGPGGGINNSGNTGKKKK